MFNVTQLLGLAPIKAVESCTHDIMLRLHSQELRGCRSLEGRYIPIHNLDELLLRLTLVITTPPADVGRWPVTEDFSGNDWEENVVVADPQIMGTVIINRRTRKISWGGKEFDEKGFLQLHAPNSAPSIQSSSLEVPRHWSKFDRSEPEQPTTTLTATRHNSFQDSSEELFPFNRSNIRFGPRVESSRTTVEWINQQPPRRETTRR